MSSYSFASSRAFFVPIKRKLINLDTFSDQIIKNYKEKTHAANTFSDGYDVEIILNQQLLTDIY